MRKVMILFFSFSCVLAARAGESDSAKTEKKLLRKDWQRERADSLFNRGRLFDKHSFLIGCDFTGGYQGGSNIGSVYDYYISPTVGYFPLKRWMIGNRFTYHKFVDNRTYENNKLLSKDYQISFISRYYLLNGRFTLYPEVAYNINFHEPNLNLVRLTHYASVGLGFNYRIWQYLSINASISVNLPWQNAGSILSLNVGVNYVFSNSFKKKTAYFHKVY